MCGSLHLEWPFCGKGCAHRIWCIPICQKFTIAPHRYGTTDVQWASFRFFSRSGIAHPLQAIKTHANSAKITPTKRPASHIDTTMAPPSRRSSPRKHEVKKATAGRTGRLTKSPARGGKRGSSPPKAAKARKYPDLTPTQISTHQHAFYAAVAQEDEGKAAN